MDNWFSAFLGQEGPQIYDLLQNMRPDYRQAMAALKSAGATLLDANSKDWRILDVACGTAIAARTLLEGRTPASPTPRQIVGLDSDSGLLDWARPFLPHFTPVYGDMLAPDALPGPFDLLIASFAYHHAPHDHKAQFCKNLATWASPRARLLVLEICLDPSQVSSYYTAVKEDIPTDHLGMIAHRFMDWTMSPNQQANGEWKVPLARALEDFRDAGWELQQKRRIWAPNGFGDTSGCFFLNFTLQGRNEGV